MFILDFLFVCVLSVFVFSFSFFYYFFSLFSALVANKGVILYINSTSAVNCTLSAFAQLCRWRFEEGHNFTVMQIKHFSYSCN